MRVTTRRTWGSALYRTRQFTRARPADNPKITSAPTRKNQPKGNIDSAEADSGLSEVGCPARRLTLPDHSSPSVAAPEVRALELGSLFLGNLAVKIFPGMPGNWTVALS